MRRTPTVDVVIPVHNRWDLTESCLQHLREQTSSHQVVVCDNGSTDGTPERARSTFPEARIVELGANLGFSVACNAGVRAGDGEIVVLLNNDVDCPPDFVERLIGPFAAHDRIGSVAAVLLRPADRRIESFGVTVDATLAGYPRLRGCTSAEAQASRPSLAGPSGAAGAYRRAAWEEVDGLDEGAFSYGEDVDLALRLRAAGWSAVGADDAVAVHVGSATARARSAWQRYQGGFSRGYFLRRYGVLSGRGAVRAFATEAIAVAGDALVYSHDIAALRGRIRGWRAAAGLPRREMPVDAVDRGITFTESLRLRRDIYSCT
jgi:GT2 family glycosyltransferase